MEDDSIANVEVEELLGFDEDVRGILRGSSQ